MDWAAQVNWTMHHYEWLPLVDCRNLSVHDSDWHVMRAVPLLGYQIDKCCTAMSCSGGDAGYRSADKREEYAARGVDWFIAMRQGKQATMDKSDPLIQAENIKGNVRAIVERGFFALSLCFIEATFVTSS